MVLPSVWFGIASPNVSVIWIINIGVLLHSRTNLGFNVLLHYFNCKFCTFRLFFCCVLEFSLQEIINQTSTLTSVAFLVSEMGLAILLAQLFVNEHSTIWPFGWVLVYKLNVSGFESSCSHLIFRFRACFEQGVPWQSGNYSVDSLRNA